MLPIDLEPNRQALLAAQESIRDQQKHLIRFLRQGKIGKMALNYFDPDVSPFTDSYLTKVLKVPDYDRSMAGRWCLTPHISGQKAEPNHVDDRREQFNEGRSPLHYNCD